MTTNFRHRSLKTVIKQYLWQSQITSCIERHRSHLVTFLKIPSQIVWSMTFWNRHKMYSAPKAQPKLIFYDENKRHKYYNFHHKFNCHITQYPHGQWQVCLVALTWQSCDADMELLIWSMTSAQPSCGWAQFKVDYYDGPNIFQLTIYYQQCTAHIKISPHKI